MTKSQKQNVPNLRFPEFSGEWVKKTVGTLAEVKTGSKDTQNRIANGKYPFYVRSDTIERINSFAYDGEAVLTSGDGVGVGRNIHYVNEKFDYHQRVYAIYKFGNELFGKFFFQFFKENFLRRVMRLSAKNSVDSIRMFMITDMLIPTPSLPEQQKIASFLSSVDKKIEQMDRKKKLLEQYKKGMMQKLFTQQIRFKDENGNDYPDWKEKKLGDISTSFSGGTPTSSNKNYYSGNIPFIGSGNIGAASVSQSITAEALKNSSAKMVEKGDLLYALYGATSGEIAISKINGAINQAILCIRTNEIVHYLYQNLLFRKEKILATFLQGGQGNLSAKIIKEMLIKVPVKAEQTKIANFLPAIDDKINLIETELTKAKTFKKGLLQQMFV